MTKNTYTRRSLLMPDDLWTWARQEAARLGLPGASAYVRALLEAARAEADGQAKKREGK